MWLKHVIILHVTVHMQVLILKHVHCLLDRALFSFWRTQTSELHPHHTWWLHPGQRERTQGVGPWYIHKVMNIRCISEAHMSPTLSGRSVLQSKSVLESVCARVSLWWAQQMCHWLHSYPGLSHILYNYVQVSVAAIPCTCLRPPGGTSLQCNVHWALQTPGLWTLTTDTWRIDTK